MKALLGSPSSVLNGASTTQLSFAETRDTNCPFAMRYACVAHFYTDLPPDNGATPTTPKFSTVEYDFLDSDHGKAKSQQKRIMMMMQMTPTHLFF